MEMEAIRSSEMSVNTIYTRRNFPEDGFLHSHRRENLKSYKIIFLDSIIKLILIVYLDPVILYIDVRWMEYSSSDGEKI
jgi:hypothetical protein